MLLTVIDRWTSWPEAYPLSATGDAASAQACAKIIVREWVPRYGVPDVITSDRGAQFTSGLWMYMCRLMGLMRDTTTAYHPQHNGKIESWHRSLKNELRARLLGRHNWIAELPWVMLGLRSSPNLDTGIAPALLVMGQYPALPGHLVVPRDDIADHTAFSERLARAMNAQTFSGNVWHGGEQKIHTMVSLCFLRAEWLYYYLFISYSCYTMKYHNKKNKQKHYVQSVIFSLQAAPL